MLKVLVSLVALFAATPRQAVPLEDMPASLIAINGHVIQATVGGVTVVGPAAASLAAVVDPLPPAGDAAVGDRGGGFSKGATLSTTLKDPDNPDEPLVVTTIQGATETDSDFIERHQTLVAKARKYIKDHAVKKEGSGG